MTAIIQHNYTIHLSKMMSNDSFDDIVFIQSSYNASNNHLLKSRPI